MAQKQDGETPLISEAGSDEPLTAKADQKGWFHGPPAEVEPPELQPFCKEVAQILGLAFPIFFASLSWVTMKTTDSALLGHTGTRSGCLGFASKPEPVLAATWTLQPSATYGPQVSACLSQAEC